MHNWVYLINKTNIEIFLSHRVCTIAKVSITDVWDWIIARQTLLIKKSMNVYGVNSWKMDMSSLLWKAELGTGKLHSNLALLHYARNTVWFGLEVGHLHKSLSAAQKLKLTTNVPHLSIGTSWLTAAFPISHYFWMFTLKVWAQVPIRQWNCQLVITRVCNTTCYIMKRVEITLYVTKEYATARIHRWA